MSQNKKYFLLLFTILITFGFFLTFYQHYKLGLPWWPSDHNLTWKFNLEMEVVPDKMSRPLKINLLIPDLNSADILSEKINAPNFGKFISKTNNMSNRMLTLSSSTLRKRQIVTYELVTSNDAKSILKFIPNISEEKNKIKSVLESDQLITLLTTAKEIAEKSADYKTLIDQAISFIDSKNNDIFWQKINNGEQNNRNKFNYLSYLLTHLNIPNLILHVVPYKENYHLYSKCLNTWLGVFYNDKWHIYDAKQGGEIFNSNDKGIVWWKNNNYFINVDGGSVKIISFSASIQKVSKEQYLDLKNNASKQNIYEFSLFNLPIKSQNFYKTIFMVPFGILVILSLRIFIGLPTLGTFIPVLISLAFKDMGLIFGIILFSLVTLLGLFFRFCFEKVQLLVISKLAMISTMVIILLAFISVIMNKLGLSFYITVFPIIILTMSIERLSVVWEERGGTMAINLGIGSLFSAIVCYFFMFNKYLEYWFFSFPSLILFIMALMLCIGRYRGYKLTELYRFKALLKNTLEKD